MKLINYALPLVLLGAMTSCQKVISVDLNSADPQYIVEGNITDMSGPYTVKLGRSVNFSAGNTFPEVSGATVVITDVTAGINDTLVSDAPGIYKTTKIMGVPGHTYTLYVGVDNHVFSAKSSMPSPVMIDSVEIEKSVFGGEDLYPVPVYQDPPGVRNRYRISITVNKVPVNDWDVREDAVTDGQVARFPFYYDNGKNSGNPSIKVGDSVAVYLQTIDSAVYEYYRTLADTKQQNAAALSNPISNVKGGALGYFSAGAVNVKSTLVK